MPRVANGPSPIANIVRAVIVSHLYADPANRAKLRSLAGLGVSLAVAVPDRWAAQRRHVSEHVLG